MYKLKKEKKSKYYGNSSFSPKIKDKINRDNMPTTNFISHNLVRNDYMK